MKNAKKTAKLHVVLDTNVIVSAFNKPEGKLAPLWPLARNRTYQLIVSPFIVKETARILRSRFHWSEPLLQERLRILVGVSHLVNPRTVPDAVPNDADDNHIIACALEGRADLIVSGDRHLLSLAEYDGIPIIRPVDFLRTVNMP